MSKSIFTKAEKRRIRLATIVDKRFKGLCWANLVDWALNKAPLRDIFNQQCTEETGAYCGKCHNAGRLSWYPSPWEKLMQRQRLEAEDAEDNKKAGPAARD